MSKIRDISWDIKPSQSDIAETIEAERKRRNIINPILSEADVKTVAALHDMSVNGVWRVCQHLKSPKDDNECPCGFRGNIWSDDEVYLLEMGITETEGSDMFNTPERDKQIMTAQYICALHNWFSANFIGNAKLTPKAEQAPPES